MDTFNIFRIFFLTFLFIFLLKCNFHSPVVAPININIFPSNGGYIKLNPDKENYKYGDKVALIAIPSLGYTLHHWQGDTNTNVDSIVVIFEEKEKNYLAVFNYLGFFIDSSIIVCNTPRPEIRVGTYAFFEIALNLFKDTLYSFICRCDGIPYFKLLDSCKGDAAGLVVGAMSKDTAEAINWNMRIYNVISNKVVSDLYFQYPVRWIN